MNILYKILVLTLLAAAGFLLVPIIVHFTIWANILNSEAAPENFLQDMIQKSSFVWIGSILVGITSLFIERRWRIALLLVPLLLPSLFVFTYIIMQGQG